MNGAPLRCNSEVTALARIPVRWPAQVTCRPIDLDSALEERRNRAMRTLSIRVGGSSGVAARGVVVTVTAREGASSMVTARHGGEPGAVKGTAGQENSPTCHHRLPVAIRPARDTCRSAWL